MGLSSSASCSGLPPAVPSGIGHPVLGSSSSSQLLGVNATTTSLDNSSFRRPMPMLDRAPIPNPATAAGASSVANAQARRAAQAQNRTRRDLGGLACSTGFSGANFLSPAEPPSPTLTSLGSGAAPPSLSAPYSTTSAGVAGFVTATPPPAPVASLTPLSSSPSMPSGHFGMGSAVSSELGEPRRLPPMPMAPMAPLAPQSPKSFSSESPLSPGIDAPATRGGLLARRVLPKGIGAAGEPSALPLEPGRSSSSLVGRGNGSSPHKGDEGSGGEEGDDEELANLFWSQVEHSRERGATPGLGFARREQGADG